MSTHTDRKKYGAKRTKVIVIDDPTVCQHCKSTGLNVEDKFCPNCSFPQGGTQGEMKYFLSRMSRKKMYLQDQKEAVNKARNILFALGGLNLLFAFLSRFDIISVISYSIGTIVYVGLGIWCNKKPFPAIISGFVVYIVLIILNFIVDPATIFSGIIWKIIIISGLVYGFRAAKEHQRLDQELKQSKESKDLSNQENIEETESDTSIEARKPAATPITKAPDSDDVQ